MKCDQCGSSIDVNSPGGGIRCNISEEDCGNWRCWTCIGSSNPQSFCCDQCYDEVWRFVLLLSVRACFVPLYHLGEWAKGGVLHALALWISQQESVGGDVVDAPSFSAPEPVGPPRVGPAAPAPASVEQNWADSLWHSVVMKIHQLPSMEHAFCVLGQARPRSRSCIAGKCSSCNTQWSVLPEGCTVTGSLCVFRRSDGGFRTGLQRKSWVRCFRSQL